MKFAYFVLPHIGGTYAVFKSLRGGLAERGVDVEWLGYRDEASDVSPFFQDEAAFGHLLRFPAGLTEQACAMRMADAIEAGGFDGVFINVLGDRLETNIARYLPDHILRIMIVHNITPGTYAAARSIRDFTHATVGVSERCRTDLVERYGFSAERTYTIANAVDTAPFAGGTRPRREPDAKLRMLFVGRIEDASKGVLWLREILDCLPDTVEMTIVGDGPDMGRLKQRLSRKPVTYLGAVAPQAIPSIMREHDILVLPSRFEGLPMTLIEAMAAGCVPVASRIRGVTDALVEDGVSGFLFPVGNYTEAANAISRLGVDRGLVQRMSSSAMATVHERYSAATMARDYHQVISAIAMSPPTIAAPLEMDDWAVPAGLRPGLRTYVPLPIKNWLRVVRERL